MDNLNKNASCMLAMLPVVPERALRRTVRQRGRVFGRCVSPATANLRRTASPGCMRPNAISSFSAQCLVFDEHPRAV